MEHLRRAGIGRRQLDGRFPQVSQAAGRRHPAEGPVFCLYSSCAGGAESLAGVCSACHGRARAGHEESRFGRGHLSGVPRTVRKTAGGRMTTRHLHNETRGYQLDSTDDRAASRLGPEAEQRKASAETDEAHEEGRMNVSEKRRPLPCPSDWSVELIEEYDAEISRV